MKRLLLVLIALLTGCGKNHEPAETAKVRAGDIEERSTQREAELRQIEEKADAAKARLERARDAMTAWINANSKIKIVSAQIRSSEQREKKIAYIRESTARECGFLEDEATREFDTAVAELKAAADTRLRWMQQHVKKPR